MEQETKARITLPKEFASIKTVNWELVEKRISTTLECSQLLILPETAESMYCCPLMRYFLRVFPFRSHPAIYWLEIVSGHTWGQVLNAVNAAKMNVDRQFPYIPENPCETKVLYVGEVKYDLRGRLITHAGYGSKPSKQGLQLCHWAQHIGLRLRVNCLILSPEAADERLLFESEIAKVLMPLIGKH